MPKKWPSKNQWRQFLKVLSKKEIALFFVFLSLAVISSLVLSFNFYFQNTKVVPAEGGVYVEGVLYSPRFINPIYAVGDVDRDLVELIYARLLRYNEKGEIIPELVKEYKVLEGGKVFEFYLKDDLLWQDGKPLTIDDVIFTIETIQNPSLKSPIRANWLGVEVEKISDSGVSFELKNPSATFIENCTLGILPKHIWEDISYQNFPLSIYNLKPVGSGPYKIQNLSQDSQGNIKSLNLVTNPHYVGNLPNIPKIDFFFFNEEEDLVKAFNSKQIKGMALEEYEDLKREKATEYPLSLPRYFAVFFNSEESKILADSKVREALNYGTNKEEIIDQVLLGNGKITNSPILPEIYGFEEPEIVYQFDIEKAKSILEEEGFAEREDGIREKFVKKEPAFQFTSNLIVGSKGSEVTELQKCLAKDTEVYPEGEVTGYFGAKTNTAVIKFQEKYKEEILHPYNLQSGTGKVYKSTREKLNELCAAPTEETLTLSLVLATVDQPALQKTAEILKNQWQELGVNLEIQTFKSPALAQDIIKPRNYETLLFGEVLGTIPDPFPFWHSSQVEDPGLNLSGYENQSCDKLLEEARQSLEEATRRSSLEEFQNILIEDVPAVFLYSPDYLHLVSEEIKGVKTKVITDPSQRFSDIENWYIETKRVWK